MRGRHFGHEGRGGGRNGPGGFRGEMVDPAWDEEPLPPPSRWRNQEDWSDREPPPPRHWERDRERDRDVTPRGGGRGGDWSSGPSPRRPPPPPLPPRNERGSNRDRYGGRGDRGSDRRRSGDRGGDRDRERDPPPPRERERRTSEHRRSGGRWSDRKSPEPSGNQSNDNAAPVPPVESVPGPAESYPSPPTLTEGTEIVPNECPNDGPQLEEMPALNPVDQISDGLPPRSHSPPPPLSPKTSSSPPPPPQVDIDADADLTAPGTEEEPPSAD